MKILVISPHADDETLGSGGTLLKNESMGGDSYWINVTNAKEEYGYSREYELRGTKEVDKVSKAYNMRKVIDLKLEPAGLQKYDISILIKAFSDNINEIQPDTLILPYPYDIHSDHKIVFDAAYTCTKSFRYPFLKRVLLMEIISETDNAMSDRGFVPNFFVNIDDFIEQKIEIMKNYAGEMKGSPFPRNTDSIRGLALYRGATCYCKYAEGFRCIKEIW